MLSDRIDVGQSISGTGTTMIVLGYLEIFMDTFTRCRIDVGERAFPFSAMVYGRNDGGGKGG